MKKSIKNYNKILLSLILSIFFMVGSFTPTIKSAKADNNILTWVFCEDHGGKENEYGRAIYKGFTTDVVPFYLKSKSAYVRNGSEKVEDNIYNKIMMFGGYEFGKEGGNPFDMYGFAGLKLSSYGGEWKYNDIDACKDNQKSGASTDYGQFYKTRYEPQEAFKASLTSDDVRSSQMIIGSSFFNVLRDNFLNIFLGISRLITSITISLIGLSFGDVSSKIGFTDQVQAGLFNNLYNGLFQPLMLLMFLATVVYLLYESLFKRQFRVAIQAVIKTVGITFLAALLYFNPQMLTYPNKVANLGQAIMISAITPKNAGYNKLCSVSAQSENGTVGTNESPVFGDSLNYLEEIGESSKSILGCRMWAEFAFRPWVKTQWNDDYENLTDLGNANEEWVGKPEVDLGGGEKITNWALFQVSTQTNQHKPIGEENAPYVDGLEPDWWRIVDAASNVRYEVLYEGSAGSNGGISSDVTSNDVVKELWKHFRKRGFTDEGIAGMLGNLEIESGFNTAIVEGENGQAYSGRGHGLAQWTDAKRLAGLKNLAKSTGRNWQDLDVQIEYLDHELSTSYSSVFKTLSNTNSIEEATRKFCREFERPQNCNGRQDAAKKHFQQKPSGSSASINQDIRIAYNDFLNEPIPKPAGSSLNGIGNFKINSKDPEGMDGAAIDNYLKNGYPDSPLIGYGDTIKQMSDKYGVSSVAFLGQVAKETTFGRAGCGGNYNFACITGSMGGRYPTKNYKNRNWLNPQSIEDGIESYFILAKEEYIDKGYENYSDYLEKYSPSGDNNDHSSFSSLMKMVGDNFGQDWNSTDVKVPGAGGNTSKSDGNGPGEGLVVEIIRPVEPTDHWNYWVGNDNYRISNAILGGLIGIISSLPPLVFAAMSSVYSVGLTLLMAVAPLFLMFGLWQGKGNQIFLSWLSTVFSLIFKKILTAFVMMISILMTTSFVSMISRVGYMKSLIFMSVVAYLLLSNRTAIIERLGTVNLPGSSGVDITEAIRNTSKRIGDAGAKAANVTGGVMLAGTISAVEAQKTGSNKKEAIKTGTSEYINNKMRSSSNMALRMAAMRGDLSKESQLHQDHLQCYECGKPIGNGTPIFQNNETGDLLCKECYDSGLFGNDFAEMSTGNCAYCGDSLSNSKEVHKNVSGQDICDKCYERFNIEEGSKVNKMGFDEEEMSKMNPTNVDAYIEFAKRKNSLNEDFNEWLEETENINNNEKTKEYEQTGEEMIPYVDENGELKRVTRTQWLIMNTGKNRRLKDNEKRKRYNDEQNNN